MTGRTARTVGGVAVMAAAAVVAYPVPVRRWYRAWRAGTAARRAVERPRPAGGSTRRPVACSVGRVAGA